MMDLFKMQGYSSKDSDQLQVNFDGRLGNWIIIYMHARIIASFCNKSLVADKLEAVEALREYSDASISYIQTSRQSMSNNGMLTADDFCGDVYQQHYLTFQPFKHEFLRIFDSGFVTEYQKWLGAKDVVIHYRGVSKELCEGQFRCIHQDVPYQYYYNILTSLKKRDRLGRVFIICPPQNKEDLIVKRIVANHHAVVRSETPFKDHCLGRAARTFIGDIGTFSWTIAYLSKGDELHLPYFSSIGKGSTWLDLAELFVHDDPRYFYHDIDEYRSAVKASFETSKMVMERNTKFASKVNSRNFTCREYVDGVLSRISRE